MAAEIPEWGSPEEELGSVAAAPPREPSKPTAWRLFQIAEIAAAVKKRWAASLSPLRITPPLRLSDWADRHFALSSDATTVMWSCLPYQRAIMDAISNDDIRIITLLKCYRIGYTQIIAASVGYHATHKRRNQIVYDPTDDDAKTFCKDVIDRMIEHVEVVSAQLRTHSLKMAANTLTLKQFAGCTVKILGGKTPRHYRGHTADIVYYDELEGFDRDIASHGMSEGSPTSLGDGRIVQSAFPKSIRGSTPANEMGSLISRSLEDAEVTFHRHLPCPACGHLQPLVWARIRSYGYDDRPLPEFDKTDLRWARIRHECEECHHGARYEDLRTMDEGGMWLSEDRAMWTDGAEFRAGGPDGDPVPAPRHVGFRIWGAYSYFISWSDGVALFMRANKAAKRGDLTLLKTWTNTYMAETWREPGHQTDWATFESRAEPYPMRVIPSGACMVTMGVDVQESWIAVVVRAWAPTRESWLVYYTEIRGDPIIPREVPGSVWATLDEVLYHEWPCADGSTWRIDQAGIDTGHKTQAVYVYARSRRLLDRKSVVMCVKGSSERKAVVVSKGKDLDFDFRGKTYHRAVRLYMVGTARIKDDMAARMALAEPGPGYFHTPIGCPEQYYRELCAERLETRMKRGREVTEWTLPAGARCEAWDCEVYAYAAAVLAGLERPGYRPRRVVAQPATSLLAGRTTPPPAPVTPPPKGVVAAPIAPPPPRQAPSGGGWISGGRGWMGR